MLAKINSHTSIDTFLFVLLFHIRLNSTQFTVRSMRSRMALLYSRCYCQTIKYAFICLTVSIVFLSSISFTIHNSSIFLFNQSQTHNNLSIYRLEQTSFYPHLPIQIYTNNRERFLRLPHPTKKLILIGSAFFDDPTWSIKSLKNKTNSGNSMYERWFKHAGRDESSFCSTRISSSIESGRA